jgi:hypothetical protein
MFLLIKFQINYQVGKILKISSCIIAMKKNKTPVHLHATYIVLWCKVHALHISLLSAEHGPHNWLLAKDQIS